MNPGTEKERLLADVLSAEPDAQFSANVLTETLRRVRRQRRMHRVRRYGAVLATVLVVTLVSSQFLRRPAAPRPVELAKPQSYEWVFTQPLLTSQLTETRLFSPDQPVVTTARVNLIKTTTGGFDLISDDELISLAAPKVVALVRRGPHEAELVFVSSPTEDSSAQQN
jgi:hypothetical protein